MTDREREELAQAAGEGADPTALVQAAAKADEALAYDAAVSIVERAEYGVLDQAARARQDQRVRLRLVEAGEGLLEALQRAAHDERLWQRLAASERGASGSGPPLSFEQELQIREILTDNIPAMLGQLGYTTPPSPPAERWVTWMQNPLTELMADGQGDPGFGRRTATAQRHRYFFVYQFRRLLAEARTQLDVQLEHQEPQEAPVMRRLLAAGVDAARERAVPAAIPAGAAAWVVTGPLGGAAGAAGGAGSAIPGDVGKELVGERFPCEEWGRWAFIAQRSLFEVLKELPGPALEDYALDMLRRSDAGRVASKVEHNSPLGITS